MIDNRLAAIVSVSGAAHASTVASTMRQPHELENTDNMRRAIWLYIFALAVLLSAGLTVGMASADGAPSGEIVHGQTVVEPAYNAIDGSVIYLLTPLHASSPKLSNPNAVAPLFLVEYPPNTSFDVPFNCHGVPGNCPDHGGIVANVATSMQPGVYGTDPNAVPGHDHLVAAPGSGGNFQVAREVIEVLFTPKAVADHAITHLTTQAAVEAAVANGYAVEVDLGIAQHFSVVSAAAYNTGQPNR
jgi:hypothetical protein